MQLLARKDYNNYRENGMDNIRKSTVSNYSYADNFFDNNNNIIGKDENDFKWDQLLSDI